MREKNRIEVVQAVMDGRLKVEEGERKEAFGMMLQIDGSPHDWLEGRGPRLTLIGAKDDATSFVWAHFGEAEMTWGYMDLMKDIFTSKELPLSLYSDRHTIFHSPKEPTIVEQINNIRPLTQFGRAMGEMGITIIKAWSAPAKGRIENQRSLYTEGLAFKGGTALRILYGSSRFSEDLDFSSNLSVYRLKTALQKMFQRIEQESIPFLCLESKETSGGYLSLYQFKLYGKSINIEWNFSLRQPVQPEAILVTTPMIPHYQCMVLPI